MPLGDESMYYKRRKEDKNRFLMVRKGNWFRGPYQCRKCRFVNVCGRLLRRLNVGERQTLDVLRRPNIDIFWIWDTSIVKGILGYTKETLRRARERGWLVPLTEINAWTVGDNVSMGVAIQMLEKSLCKGRNTV